MQSLPENYRALVIGASGGIGAAFAAQLRADSRCASVEALHRNSATRIDFTDEQSIAAAAAALAIQSQFHLIIIAAGVLHGADFMPEKKLGDLNFAQLQQTFQANTFGPALVLRHFAPLLSPERSLFVALSAKVGSIEDNRLGGWYSYRASKAALNMLVKTAAIEIKRSNQNAVLVALHPGTVNTGLSKPFKGETLGRSADAAASEMLAAIDALTPADSGKFIAYDGAALPW